MKKPKCLLFDCDGVLIDVTNSYREVIKTTVQMYLKDCLKIKDCQRTFVTDKDIESFKNAGGYNNDWELTSGLLEMFLGYIPSTKVVPIKLHNIPRIIKFLNFVGPQLKTTGNKLLVQKNVAAFLKQREESPSPNPNSQTLLFNKNELYNTNLVKRLFQELYLGKQYFSRVYHRRPLLYENEGYIERENPFISRKDLERLSHEYILGIVTGRPFKELEIALLKFGLGKYFSVIITHEDIEEEEKKNLLITGQPLKLGKPNPYGLLLAVDKLGLNTKETVAYLGDLPDDIKAANAAKKSHPFLSVGVGQVAANNKKVMALFIQAGADQIIEKVTEIGKLFS